MLSLGDFVHFLCGDGYLGGGATDRHEILHGGRCGSRIVFSLLGYPQVAPKSRISIANILKTVSCSITCQNGT